MRIGTWMAAALVAAGSLRAQPNLTVVEGTSFDLGRLERGVVTTKRLTLKNTGNQKLSISNVEVSCGCTGTVVSSKELKAGDTTSLLITFNSRNFSGAVHKTVWVVSNAAGQPRTQIDFTATIVEELVFSPLQFFFKDAEAGKRNTATIRVKNESLKNMMITGYRTQLQNFVIKYPPKPIKPGETMDITAEFTPRYAMPVLSDGVFITTSSKTLSEVYIYVFGNVRDFKFD